jgi:deoxycytidine triphosphate deaminase
MSTGDETAGPRQALAMLSNRCIREFMRDGLIRITPFRDELLAPSSYRLRCHRIRFHRVQPGGTLEHGSYSLEDGPYNLSPNEHVVISVEEQIVLSQGLVGTFYPASRCVEAGLILTAGRLDAEYDMAIVFGVFNASGEDVELTSQFEIARVGFTWLGSENMPDYSAAEPGAYIPHIETLRKGEETLDAEPHSA